MPQYTRNLFEIFNDEVEEEEEEEEGEIIEEVIMTIRETLQKQEMFIIIKK